jgi:hypothetical protein
LPRKVEEDKATSKNGNGVEPEQKIEHKEAL